MENRGNELLVTFRHAGSGLVAVDTNELKGSAVAGKDRKFVWAKAKIVGKDKVEVWSEAVPAPGPRTLRLGR